jgi:hypothetical protein
VNLAGRVIGIIRRPRTTFEAVVAAPRWMSLLTTLTLFSGASGGLFLATEVGRLALVDQWERTAFAFGRPVDDAGYEGFHRLSRWGPAYAAATSLLGVAGAAIGAAAVAFFAVPARPTSTSFHQVLAVSTHAAVILALKHVVAAPLGYLRESTINPTALGRLFPSLNETSPVARVLGTVDVLVLWWMVVLAIGLGVAYRRPARPLALTCVGIYIVLVLGMAGVMAITGGTV